MGRIRFRAEPAGYADRLPLPSLAAAVVVVLLVQLYLLERSLACSLRRTKDEGRRAKEVKGIEKDVEEFGPADRAEAADERGYRPPQEARHPLRDRLLQEQGPFLALRSVRPPSPSLASFSKP